MSLGVVGKYIRLDTGLLLIVSHCVENKPLTLLLSIVYFVKHEKGWIWKYAVIEKHTLAEGDAERVLVVEAARVLEGLLC